MCSIESLISTAYHFLSEWQTLGVAVFTIYWAWYQWEVTALIPKIDEKGESELKDNDIDQFARRLRNLPLWLARKTFRAAILKSRGSVVWAEALTTFENKHREWRKNYEELKRSGYL